MIGLRSDDQVDGRGAVHDFLAFGLGDATRDGDGHAAFATRQLVFAHFLEPADFGIDLFGGLFADMAGIEQHQVGAGGLVGDLVAQRPQQIGHAFAVIDIHLTAVGLDMKLLGRARLLRRDGRFFL